MRRLGRHKSPHDKRTIHFADVVSGTLPAFPEQLAQDASIPDETSQYANDHVGDCTVASFAHLEEVWTSNGQFRRLLTTEEVISFYSLVAGYSPDDTETDRGANMMDVLRSLRSVGIGADKRRIEAYVKIDHRDVDHVKSAINLFGGVYVGADLPVSAETALEKRQEWSITDDAAGAWGGHCMSASRYDRRGVTFRTWGKLQFADWSWWHAYVDECWAIVDQDWLRQDGLAPNGLNIGKLRTFLIALDTNANYTQSRTQLAEGLVMNKPSQVHKKISPEAARLHPYSNLRPTIYPAWDPLKDPVVTEQDADVSGLSEDENAESHSREDENDGEDGGHVLTE